MRLIIGNTRAEDRLTQEIEPGTESQPVDVHPNQSLREFCSDYCIEAVDSGPLNEISRTFACRLHLFQDGLYQEQIGRSGKSIFSRHPFIDSFAQAEDSQPERATP